MNKETILEKLNDIIEMIETDSKVTGQCQMTAEAKKYAYNVRLELIDLYEEANKKQVVIAASKGYNQINSNRLGDKIPLLEGYNSRFKTLSKVEQGNV